MNRQQMRTVLLGLASPASEGRRAAAVEVLVDLLIGEDDDQVPAARELAAAESDTAGES